MPVRRLPLVGTHLLIAVTVGLVAGIGEILIARFYQVVLGRFVGHEVDTLWMIPLANGSLIAVPGIVTSLLALWLDQSPGRKLTIGVAGFWGAYGMLRSVAGLHRVAVVVLALGGALRLSQALHRQFVPLARWCGWLALSVTVTCVGIGLGRGLPDSAPGPASASSLPTRTNVLFVILDTVREKSLSLYGYQRSTTPNLAYWARRGVTFNRAFAPSSWTIPSHASFFTGRLPHEVFLDWRYPVRLSNPTIAEVLGTLGYRTGAFIANIDALTLERGLDRGFERYDARAEWSPAYFLSRARIGQAITRRLDRENQGMRIGRRDAAVINQTFLDWLDQSDHRPFFAFLNFFDAHDPYVAPRPFATIFDSIPVSLPDTGPATPAWGVFARRMGLRRLTNAYDGSIAYLDQQLGQLMTTLDRRGLLDSTIVIIASDHGELLGEHGFVGHRGYISQPVLQVPLVIFSPHSVPANTRIDTPVSLIDLPATILDLANAGVNGTVQLPGQSLATRWGPDRVSAGLAVSEAEADTTLPRWIPISRGPLLSVATERWHYIRQGDGSEELYDLVDDRNEMNNLADSATVAAVVAHLRWVADSASRTGTPNWMPPRALGVRR